MHQPAAPGAWPSSRRRCRNPGSVAVFWAVAHEASLEHIREHAVRFEKTVIHALRCAVGRPQGSHLSVILNALRGLRHGQHSASLTEHGEVHTWSSGDDGRLGHGDEDEEYVPRIVEKLKGKRVVSIICGDEHTMVVTRPFVEYSADDDDDDEDYDE